MPRRLVFTALAAALVATAAPAAAQPVPAPVKAKLMGCETALDQADRFAVFEGEMRSVAGASRLQMRFSLRGREPGHDRWVKVAAPGFGTWISATPGVRRFVYTRRVEDLLAPARYRVIARYRWLDAAGAVLRTAERRTPVCRQTDRRANLVPLSIDIEPGSMRDTRTYVVPVTNDGGLGADRFTVRLTVDGKSPPVSQVEGVHAGERMLVSFEAPTCRPGSVISVTVDADGVIDEADEADNTITASCPSEA